VRCMLKLQDDKGEVIYVGVAEMWALLCFIFSFNLPSILIPCLSFYHTILMQLFSPLSRCMEDVGK